MLKICSFCNEEYNAKKSKQKYCSFDCRVNFQKTKANEKNKNCLECNIEISHQKKKYCSRECRFSYESKHFDEFSEFYKKRSSSLIGKESPIKGRPSKLKGRLRNEKIEVVCLCCGKIFINTSKRIRKYCSIGCSAKIYKCGPSLRRFEPKKCYNCGKPLKNNKFCNKECGVEYRKNNPHLYIDGIERMVLGVKKAFLDGKFKNAHKLSSERMKIKNPSFDPKVVEKQKASLKNFFEKNPHKLAERLKNFMNAPLRGRGFEGRNPTKLEKFIIDIGSNKVRYTGAGSFWICFKNGKKKNPDFKVNGVKKVVEVGDTQYWHTIEEIKETVAFYKEIGYECLYFTDIDIKENPEKCKLIFLDFVNCGEEREIQTK